MEKTEKLAQVVRYTFYPAVWNVDLYTHWKTIFCHKVLTLLFCLVAILLASPCTCAGTQFTDNTNLHKLRMCRLITNNMVAGLRLSIGFFPKRSLCMPTLCRLAVNIMLKLSTLFNIIDGLDRALQYGTILLTTWTTVCWQQHIVQPSCLTTFKKFKKCQFERCLYPHVSLLLCAERNAHHL